MPWRDSFHSCLGGLSGVCSWGVLYLSWRISIYPTNATTVLKNRTFDPRHLAAIFEMLKLCQQTSAADWFLVVLPGKLTYPLSRSEKALRCAVPKKTLFTPFVSVIGSRCDWTSFWWIAFWIYPVSLGIVILPLIRCFAYTHYLPIDSY